MLLAEHFVRAPDWRWYILLYFFFAGLSGGTYVLGSMLRWWGRPGDEPTARVAFITAFVLLLLCPILLTIDLGQPSRFWHMIWDSGQGGFNFKSGSPMSAGVWGLTVYGAFSFVAFLEAVYPSARALLGGLLGRLLNLVGSIQALFLCAYTGVLLSVSNQPVWSDGWPLGGLFLASALSGSAALLLLLRRQRPELDTLTRRLTEADFYFVLLEALVALVFLVTVAAAGTLARLFGGISPLLWLLVLIGLAVPIAAHLRPAGSRLLGAPAAGPLLVLAGVLALRAVVIFGPQG